MSPRQEAVRLPMMQPLRRPSIIDQAELELRNAIYVGDLRPGDTIPEVQVSKQMGISRSSLREACQRLVRDGLLTQIPGRGLFVTTMDARTMSDFIDYRLGIEMQSASIVADRVAGLRAGGDDAGVAALLAPLRETLERTRRALEAEEVIEAGNADLDLHLQIAEITRNRFLISSMNTIVILTRMGSFSDPLGYGVRADLTEANARLLDALDAGDDSRARAVLRETLKELAGRLRSGETHQELVRDPDLLESDGPEWTTLGEE
ncbi:GntR family transcriptional regulator [Brachybacterium saurashtrense]|uniref:GntR family transcriptional regulator n=1 Tax=Brachybacterium saurashtrense TaxID=556288 RepID=A0A345YK72_9MICO|nr:GntR family transcriptional regulator [Brachybacterium saurashtrense]AXK44324.1 GntR family transcriptional regulator [Brachybacterium saurashtrense]RRR21360.1 GntR family transcriptional regulator [Brachybacterium saurashtrense]RRR22935.1 GntR family transcriptional regulator [Brachybacterium saurashtrense]